MKKLFCRPHSSKSRHSAPVRSGRVGVFLPMIKPNDSYGSCIDFLSDKNRGIDLIIDMVGSVLVRRPCSRAGSRDRGDFFKTLGLQSLMTVK